MLRIIAAGAGLSSPGRVLAHSSVCSIDFANAMHYSPAVALDAQLVFRIDKEAKRALERKAKAEQRTPGAVARRLVREGLGLQPRRRPR